MAEYSATPSCEALETIVESFERARATMPSTDLGDYLPCAEDPQYLEVLVELVRSDLEFSFQEERPRPLRHYLEAFPELSGDADALRDVAFEEYRLYFRAGQPQKAEDYAARYAIDTSNWPSWTQRDRLPLDRVSESQQAELATTWASQPRLSTAESDSCGDTGNTFPDVGSMFGDFELVDELGRGAYGRVFLARQGDLASRCVALKVTVERNAEPQRLAELQHTNIVPIYSVHQVGRLQAVCMPFLGSATLADVRRELWTRGTPATGQQVVQAVNGQRQWGPLGHGIEELPSNGTEADENTPVNHQQLLELNYADAIVWLLARTADGLAHAHERGVIHCDLKPANVLISDDCTPLILDFHLSTSASGRGRDAAFVGGTLPYMAPEQIEMLCTGGTVTPACDVYSLGVILFEMLTGRSPFPLRRGHPEDVVGQMLVDRDSPPPSIRDLNPALSPDVAAITARCLSPDPRGRYASARELQADLERHLKDLPPRYARSTSLAERVRKWSRRHPRLASATTIGSCAAVALCVLVAGLVVGQQRLAAANARESLREFREALTRAEPPLVTNNAELGFLSQSIQDAAQLLRVYQADTSNVWREEAPYTLLDAAGRRSFAEGITELRYLSAVSSLRIAPRVASEEEARQLRLQAGHFLELAKTHFKRTPRALLIQQAKLASAKGEFDRAQSLNELAAVTRIKGKFERYLLAFAGGSHGTDDSLLNQVLRDSPRNPVVQYVCGNLLIDLDQLSRAEACYTTALTLAPDMVLPRLFRGQLCEMNGRYVEALKDFDEVLRNRPDWPDALFNRALVAYKQGRLQDARDDLDAGLELRPNSTKALLNRAKIRRQLGDLKGARRDREDGLASEPTDWKGWLMRGIAQLPESPDLALRDFRRAAELNGDSPEPWMNIASLLSEKMHDLPGAIDAMDRAIESGTPCARRFANRAILHARVGNRKAALTDVRSALELSRSPEILFRACGIYAQTSRQVAADGDVAIRFLIDAAWNDAKLVLKHIESDADLEPLHGHPEFRRTVSDLKRAFRKRPPPARPQPAAFTDAKL